MLIRVRNVKYFDWEVPQELVTSDNLPHEIIQQLIDEHFDPDHLSVDQVSDEYYEFEETIEE